ncbi:MAG TPA: hypothetical protein VFH62_04130 [Dehalococcoidia bacterium]|jgi:hypothetical protein|nr:hypothetical protein [Dehalococcoidia bacterium]
MMMSLHLRCLGAAAALAFAAIAVPVIAVAMSLIVVAGVGAGAVVILRAWFDVDAPEAEQPVASLPRVPALWV